MADSKLYDVLGVSRGATESEIRRVSKEMLSLGVEVYSEVMWTKRNKRKGEEIGREGRVPALSWLPHDVLEVDERNISRYFFFLHGAMVIYICFLTLAQIRILSFEPEFKL